MTLLQATEGADFLNSIDTVTLYWILFGAIMLASLFVQAMLKNRFNKFSKVPTRNGMTGADVARKMLSDNGIYDVQVVPTSGVLTDHYDPTKKTVALSEAVYASNSIAAAAVAAHECGHAVQHAKGYGPLQMRSALVPVVCYSSRIMQWVIFLGLIFFNIFPALLWIGIGMFALTTLFSFITLPVEFNASRRALAWIPKAGITNYESQPMAESALKWAASTYVVAALSSLATLLYYILLASRRR